MYNQYDESETYLICLSSEEKKARKRPIRPKIINHTNNTAQIENKIVPLPLPDCKAKPNSKQGKAKQHIHTYVCILEFGIVYLYLI